MSKRFQRGFQDLKHKMTKWVVSFSSQTSTNADNVEGPRVPNQFISLPNYPIRYTTKKVQTRKALLRHLDLPASVVFHRPNHNIAATGNHCDIEMIDRINQNH